MTGFAVIRDDTPTAVIPKGAVVAMGNFDGVHRGHRAVIGACLDMARIKKAPALAVTFEPHPRKFFSPDVPQFRLTDETAKLRLLAGTGLDGAVILSFDARRASTTAHDFIQHELIGRLGVQGIAIGYDFHFGKGRGGSPSMLVAEAPSLGIEVDVQPHVDFGDHPVSSSAIRKCLEEGHIAAATEMLGGPWFVTGEVIHGDKRGRDLGYPTHLVINPPRAANYAARTVRRKRATSSFSRVLSCASDCAADSTCAEAEPVAEAPR
jgi:riboflavin kinase/FMN adenylyltransferase